MEQPPLKPEQIEAQIGVMQAVFREVAPIVLAHVGEKDFVTKDRDGSPVTPADVEVEGKILAELKRQMPGVPVFGEESGYGDDMPPTFWLIDPIDGTRSYIDGVPHFTTMGVLIQGGEAMASVIFNPSTDNMYTAQQDRGSFKNGERLDLSKMPVAKVVLVKRRFIESLDELLAPAGVHGEFVPAGGGYDFSQVADGRAAGRFNMLGGGYPHDYATGALLVAEAGGVNIPILEDEYNYKTVSFASVHPSLAPLVREHVPQLRSLEQAAQRGK